MTSARGWRWSAVHAALVLVLPFAAATAAAPAASEPRGAPGKLDFELTLRQSGPFQLPCPTDAIACVPWTGSGSIRGLGKVSVTYDWLLGVGPPACAADFAKRLTTIGQLSVVGKGTINVTFAEGAGCLPFEGRVSDWWYEPQEFAITGGTGRFAAATGRGTRLMRLVVAGASAATEAWMATLEVPGHAFDVTPPTLRGGAATTVRVSKTARSARVTFTVKATDGVDGTVPVSCQPRSGSRFKTGKTTVRCEATDSSANTGKEAFTVTVKRQR